MAGASVGPRIRFQLQFAIRNFLYMYIFLPWNECVCLRLRPCSKLNSCHTLWHTFGPPPVYAHVHAPWTRPHWQYTYVYTCNWNCITIAYKNDHSRPSRHPSSQDHSYPLLSHPTKNEKKKKKQDWRREEPPEPPTGMVPNIFRPYRWCCWQCAIVAAASVAVASGEFFFWIFGLARRYCMAGCLLFGAVPWHLIKRVSAAPHPTPSTRPPWSFFGQNVPAASLPVRTNCLSA